MAVPRLLVGLLLVLCCSSTAWAWDKDVRDLLRWLNLYGYSDFARALQATGLDRTLVQLLDEGHELTLLAPNNNAMRTYVGPECGIPIRTVLSLHILDGTYSAASILADPVGRLYPSGTGVPVSKRKNRPLRLGVQSGFLKWYSTARVIAGDTYKTPRGITVHGMSAVIQYPCYAKFFI